MNLIDLGEIIEQAELHVLSPLEAGEAYPAANLIAGVALKRPWGIFHAQPGGCIGSLANLNSRSDQGFPRVERV